MPFVTRIQRWADERPDHTAIAMGRRRLSWAELRAAAERLVPDVPPLSVLNEANSPEFAVRFTAAVAGERRCAVLDPSWPQDLRDDMTQRLALQPVGTSTAGTKLVDGHPDTPFLIGLTAGTTSVPKAFTRSRYSWQRSFEASIEFFGLRQNDKTLAPGPLAASLNLYALAECLYAGSEFHTLERFDVGAAHAAIRHDGITRLVLVPTMLRLLSERGLTGAVDASGVRSIICAGSKLDARTLEAARRWAPNATIFEYYGASELSFVAGVGLAAGAPHPAGAGLGLGGPFPGVELRILADDGARLPDGEAGNIGVRSAMVSNGYLWGDDGQAMKCFDGWYTVGDHGYLERGELHLLGRRSDMIISAGKNIYPHEVELALASIPGVSAAVAAGAPDDIRGQLVVAGVVGSHGALTATVLKSGLEGVLARDKWPLQYFALAELPVTDRGKVSRQILLDWIDRGDARIRRLV